MGKPKVTWPAPPGAGHCRPAFALAGLAAGLVIGLVFAPHPAAAEAWAAEKCRRYERAWQHLLVGAPAPGAAFVAAQEAFIAGGCSQPGAVCPRSETERALADLLALMAVAEGMAGSFLPFGCPHGS